LNEGTITLERAETHVPEQIGSGDTAVVPFHAGERLAWRLVG
jgi:dihydroorotase